MKNPAIRDRIPEIRRAIDFRNTLVHGYSKIRMDEVVRIVRNDLPELIAHASIVLRDDYE